MENHSERPGEELKNNIREDVQSIKQEAKAATAELGNKARQHVEAGKDQAADTLDQLSEAIDQMADSISENDKLGLASYVHSASSQLAALATRLQERSVDELAEDARQLARRQPAAFLLGSVALGFGLSRFVKASSHKTSRSNLENRTAQGPVDDDVASPARGASPGETPESVGASW